MVFTDCPITPTLTARTRYPTYVSVDAQPSQSSNTASDAVGIIIADDAPEIRQLVKTMLQLSEDPVFNVLGEASNGLEALQLVSEHYADVQVVVLDIAMPKMDGLQALTRLHEEHPELKVVMLSGFETQEFEEMTQKLGAAAYIEKSGPSLVTIAQIISDLLA